MIIQEGTVQTHMKQLAFRMRSKGNQHHYVFHSICWRKSLIIVNIFLLVVSLYHKFGLAFKNYSLIIFFVSKNPYIPNNSSMCCLWDQMSHLTSFRLAQFFLYQSVSTKSSLIFLGFTSDKLVEKAHMFLILVLVCIPNSIGEMIFSTGCEILCFKFLPSEGFEWPISSTISSP